jgi:hypothetical protein
MPTNPLPSHGPDAAPKRQRVHGCDAQSVGYELQRVQDITLSRTVWSYEDRQIAKTKLRLRDAAEVSDAQ